jgi:hypothetical protein
MTAATNSTISPYHDTVSFAKIPKKIETLKVAQDLFMSLRNDRYIKVNEANGKIDEKNDQCRITTITAVTIGIILAVSAIAIPIILTSIMAAPGLGLILGVGVGVFAFSLISFGVAKFASSYFVDEKMKNSYISEICTSDLDYAFQNDLKKDIDKDKIISSFNKYIKYSSSTLVYYCNYEPWIGNAVDIDHVIVDLKETIKLMEKKDEEIRKTLLARQFIDLRLVDMQDEILKKLALLNA